MRGACTVYVFGLIDWDKLDDYTMKYLLFLWNTLETPLDGICLVR